MRNFFTKKRQNSFAMQLCLDRGTCNIVKFAMAVLVALHHFSLHVCAADPQSNIIVRLLSSQGGYTGVAVFFFLSGYGLMESELHRHLDFGAFLKKRFLKIYLPTVLATALWLPLYYSINQHFEPNFGGGRIAYDLLFGFGDGVLWFIKILFMLYAAFGLFGALRQRHEIGAWSVLLLATIIIYWAAYRWVGHFAPLSVPLFGLGVFASRYKSKNYGCFNATFIPLTLCLAATIAVIAVAGIKSSVYHVVANYFIIAAMLLLFTRFRISIPVQRTVLLGALSFDLYLVHNKILTLLTHQIDVMTLCNFVALAAVATLLFHLLRTKIIKL